MKKFKEKFLKLSGIGVFNALALFVALSTINIACAAIYHQPEMPKALDNLRKY